MQTTRRHAQSLLKKKVFFSLLIFHPLPRPFFCALLLFFLKKQYLIVPIFLIIRNPVHPFFIRNSAKNLPYLFPESIEGILYFVHHPVIKTKEIAMEPIHRTHRVHRPSIKDFSLEEKISRLFPQESPPLSQENRPPYLDYAERIINQAVEWIDTTGEVIDPVEGADRWKGGSSSRYACPAAILIHHKQRKDLLPSAIRAMDQVTGRSLSLVAKEKGTLPGVFDLTMKELVVAWHFLRPYVDNERASCWKEAIQKADPDFLYCSDSRLASGERLHNFGVSSSVGEWLRVFYDMNGSREYVEYHLDLQLAHVTQMGMYRDPHDPMLYDAMVRQNFSELLYYGYDGPLKEDLQELLRRSGLITLLYLSPCGYIPYGGRSNGLIHNEAMAAYILEYQAHAYTQSNQKNLAYAFREGAIRAIHAIEPYLSSSPLRALKNRFAPSTRHGKDSHYGEYANYTLLAASILARTSLITDSSIPAAADPVLNKPYTLYLAPSFHKVFATCQDTSIEIDTRANLSYDPTGLGRFHKKEAPPDLALSSGITANPTHILYNTASGRSAAIGPCWKTGSLWRSLAELSPEIEEVSFSQGSETSQSISWSILWEIASGARVSIESFLQKYLLKQGSLTIDAEITGVYDLFGFEVPCLSFNGEEEATIEPTPHGVTVTFSGWKLCVTTEPARFESLSKELYGNRFAHYRIARFISTEPKITACLTLNKEKE